MEVLLLELVISSGAHMAAEGERARNLWMQVNKDIFLNYPFQGGALQGERVPPAP